MHHLLLETAHHSYDQAWARLAEAGLGPTQSAMLNLALQLGALTLPAAPKLVAEPLSTHFAYADTASALGTTLELAQFPPGISRPLGLRIGKADSFAPPDARTIVGRLPNSLFDKVAKLGFVVHDVERSVARWSEQLGVGPWHIVDMDERSVDRLQLATGAGPLRARVAWALVGSVLLELVQPISGDLPHRRALAERGEGIHSIGVTSDALDIAGTVAELAARGCPTLMQGVLHGGYEFALVDTQRPAHVWLELMRLDAQPLFEELKRLPGRRYPA